MDIFSVLDELQEIVEHSARIPVTGKVIIGAETILDHLDRLRTMLPEEVRQARWVTKERERVLLEAREESRRLMEETERQTEHLASDTEVVRQSKALAEKTILEAQQSAWTIRNGAYSYADEVLGELEKHLEELLQTVRRGRQELKRFPPEEESEA